jgi:predicted SprT family Zn-dependent metalloprotease
MRYDTDYAIYPYNCACLKCGLRFLDKAMSIREVNVVLCRKCQANDKLKLAPAEETSFDFRGYIKKPRRRR